MIHTELAFHPIQPMKMKTYLSVILAAVALAGAMPTIAQTTNIILQTDYDGDAEEGNFNYAYGYCVAGSSAGSVGANSTGGVISGAGVDGTLANSITPNYTFLPSDPNWTNPALSYVYALVGNGIHIFGAHYISDHAYFRDRFADIDRGYPSSGADAGADQYRRLHFKGAIHG